MKQNKQVQEFIDSIFDAIVAESYTPDEYAAMIKRCKATIAEFPDVTDAWS